MVTSIADMGRELAALPSLHQVQPVVPSGAAGDLIANLQEHAHHARGAYSENTERALRSDTAVFAAWCRGRGLTALPASPGVVAAFVDAMAHVRAPATVRRYVSSIASLHRAAGLESPAETELGEAGPEADAPREGPAAEAGSGHHLGASQPDARLDTG